VFKKVNTLFDSIIRYFSVVARMDGDALDCGCGTGILASNLVRYGFNVDLVDISKEMVDISKKKLNKLKQQYKFKDNYYVSDVESFLEKNKKKYDLICFTAVLHHIEDYINVLNQACKYLKPNGYIIIIDEPELKEVNRKWYCKILDFIEGNYINFYRFIKNPKHAINFIFNRKVYNIDVDLAEYHSKKGVNQNEIMQTLEKNELTITNYNSYINHVSSFFEYFNFLYKNESKSFWLAARKIIE